MDHVEIQARLGDLALKKSQPFCYSCYRAAHSGRCALCGSDDLMRELAGEGVEYGTDWIVRALVRDNLTPVDTEEAFAESIRDCYPEATQVGWLTLDTVSVLMQMDPVAWDLAQSEWIAQEEAEGLVISFDHGVTYYWTHDVEFYLDEAEGVTLV